jgi:hypothetical protein
MSTETLNLNPTQLAVARCVRILEMNCEPKCEECGYGADRPKCAMDMGGHCPRHEQKEVMAFNRARDSMIILGGLRDLPMWRYRIPLHLLYDFSDRELGLLRDLRDAGGKQATRDMDKRFNTLGSGSGIAKGAVSLSHNDGRWRVELSDRGRALLAHLDQKSETADA